MKTLDYITRAPYRFLTENGRSALYRGMGLLERSGGKDTVLLPSYNCGTEIESAVSAGHKVSFYRIDRSCRPDLNDLERRIDGRTLAVLVTHFNGFPQPIAEIRDICRRKGVYLIEDCAHVLRTEVASGALGEYGDIAVFSQRKYLPVVNGGILAVWNGNLIEGRGVEPAEDSDNDRVAADIIILFKNWLKQSILKNRTASGQEGMDGGAPCVYDFSEGRYDRGASRVSRYLFQRLDLESIAGRRRANYGLLHERLSDTDGVRCLAGALSAGVCPLYYLAEVEAPWKLHSYMARKGIWSAVFWNFFHKDFPFAEQLDAEYLKRHVIALPVHHGVTLSDIGYMAETVQGFFRQ